MTGRQATYRRKKVTRSFSREVNKSFSRELSQRSFVKEIIINRSFERKREVGK